MQTFKTAINRMSVGSIENKVSHFLLKYRVTPYSTMGYHQLNSCLEDSYICTTLDLLQPNIGYNVRQNPTKQKEGHDVYSKSLLFNQGNTVFVKSLARQMLGFWSD